MAEQLLTAAELARWLHVERDYVYAHADELAGRCGSEAASGPAFASTPTRFAAG